MTVRQASEDELVGELLRKFPLFGQIIGCFGTAADEERLPLFLAIVLSAAGQREPGPCCFVLNKTPGTTVTAAVILGLTRLHSEFNDWISDYAEENLQAGQRVRVRPNDLVYEYDGPWREHPGEFRLRVLESVDYRSIAMTDVLRLDPTERKRPKGTLTSNLGEFDRSPMDALLDLSTYGNSSVIRNAVLVHMAHVRFLEVVDEITMGSRGAGAPERLSSFLPWGSIGPGGVLRSNDEYQKTGEPLVAVTKVPEDLALAASKAPPGTRSVLVDGATSVTRNLQAFDEIAGRQRLVILASPDENEEVEILARRDFAVWRMTPDEILIGEDASEPRARTSLFGLSTRSADLRRRTKVSTVDCEDDGLQDVLSLLDRIEIATASQEESADTEKVLYRLYGMLCDCSECCLGVGGDASGELHSAREEVARNAMWMEPAVMKDLTDAVGGLARAYARGYGEHKADALLEVLNGIDGDWVIATRSPRTAECLREGLQGLGVEFPVQPIRLLRPDREYDGVILTAWPGRQRFVRLTNLAVTEDIRLIAYRSNSDGSPGIRRARGRMSAQAG